MILSKSLVILLAGTGFAVGTVTPPPAAPRSAGEALRGFGRSVAIAGEFAFVGELTAPVGTYKKLYAEFFEAR